MASLTSKDHSGPAAQCGKTRVLIVDDSLVARTVMQRVISAAPDIIVADEASSAEAAIAKLHEISVDVILLDLEMPGLGGLEALPRILAQAGSAKVLVVSTLTQQGALATLTALARGAADTLPKPAPGSFHDDYKTALLEKIRGLRADASAKTAGPLASHVHQPKGLAAHAVGIGASTGGVHALAALLGALPDEMALPIIVTQHLPAAFMPVFARQLAAAGSRECVVADTSTPLEDGLIIVAPGDAHLVVERSGGRMIAHPRRFQAPSGCTPSVDPMLESLAGATDGHVTGVILSGMGRDGLEGSKALVDAGGTLLAQNEETSAVWGMPGCVVGAKLAHAVLPPDQIGRKIAALAEARAWI